MPELQKLIFCIWVDQKAAYILGDPGAVSRVDKMFVILKFTVNFYHEHFIDPTNCPWVSEDGPLSARTANGFCGMFLLCIRQKVT